MVKWDGLVHANLCHHVIDRKEFANGSMVAALRSPIWLRALSCFSPFGSHFSLFKLVAAFRDTPAVRNLWLKRAWDSVFGFL